MNDNRRIFFSTKSIMRTVKKYLEKHLKLREKYLSARLYRKIIGQPKKGNGSIRIVAINHFFDQDIDAVRNAAKYCGSVELDVIDANVLSDFAMYYLPPFMPEFKGYYTKEYEGFRKKLKDKYSALLIDAKGKNDNIVFLSPSDQFFWIREFVSACKEVGFPFIVLDKEGTITPHYMELFSKDIKENMPVIGDHILVWSKRQEQFYISSGCQREIITVVGQPRSDYWFDKSLWPTKDDLFKNLGLNQNNKTVLYFDFERHYYVYDSDYENGFNWDAIIEDIHSALFELAEKHPEVNFVFKLHPQATNVEKIKEKVKATSLRNIKVLTGASLSRDLIVHSDLIICFQTTALLDTMLTDKPIIYTFWGNVLEYKNKLLPFHECNGIDIACGKGDFKQMIEERVLSGFTYAPTNCQKNERKKFTDEFFFCADGMTGKRVLDRILELRGR